MSLAHQAVARIVAALGWLVQLAWSVLLGALSAHRCAACNASLVKHAAFCPDCADTVVIVEHTYRAGEPGQVLAFGQYGGALADALLQLKYGDRPDLARPLAHLLLSMFRSRQPAALHSCEAVVPVPLHPRRLAERGYNQASLLARPVAEELGVPLLAGALRRTIHTTPQARLDAVARRRNVRGAFRVAKPGALSGKVVLLIDDVCTTGATLTACATALRGAGARATVALVVARADLPTSA